MSTENPDAIGGCATLTDVFGWNLLGKEFAQQVDNVK
jgi:hypothetical protein